MFLGSNKIYVNESLLQRMYADPKVYLPFLSSLHHIFPMIEVFRMNFSWDMVQNFIHYQIAQGYN